jgi:CubicO group peptidase (beta-lactamase class C family)
LWSVSDQEGDVTEGGSTLLTLTLVLAACGGGTASQAERPEARIDRVLNGLVPVLAIRGEPAAQWPLRERMEHYHVPGVSIAVIDSGRIVWTRAVGLKEAGGTDPVDTATVFQAGSISKPTFAVGVMRLVQDGKLSLDRNVNDQLTSWKVPDNRFTVTQKVTLRRILSHTAGLTVHGFPGYPPGDSVPTVVQILDGRPPANTAPVRVDTVPGTLSRYSGGGTTVAMLLVTDVTGRPFPDLMHDLVLGPAGMTRSTYQQPLPAAFAVNAASGHTGAGEVVPGRYNTYPEMSAAGLWTTPTDLARLALELERTWTGASSPLVSRATLEQMFTVQPPLTSDGFGIGYHISGTGPDLEFSHGGADIGFRAEFVAFAERGQGAVVMANGDGGDRLAGELLASIAAEYGWPSHHPTEKVVLARDSAALAPLAGEYGLDVGGPKPMAAFVTIEAGKAFLDLQSIGMGKVELLADSDSTYFLRELGYPVEFPRNQAGRIESIVVAGSVSGRKVR